MFAKNSRVLLLTLCWLWAASPLWACHRGGQMGFAKKDPGASTVDVTSSSAFTFASTSGTSGCQNWEMYARQQSSERSQALLYVPHLWQAIKEEATQGTGEHLTALRQMLGCPAQQQPQFNLLLQRHYAGLFQSDSAAEPQQALLFMEHLETLLQQQALTCGG